MKAAPLDSIPENWTEEKEEQWQELCAEVDFEEYDEYARAGGNRTFNHWREHECVTCLPRHPSSWVEYEHRPSGPVDYWEPAVDAADIIDISFLDGLL